MTLAKITAAAYSIQQAKAQQAFGQLATLPVFQGTRVVLLRVALAGIPKGATITSATMKVTQSGAVAAGTHSLTLYRITSSWTSSVTWGNQPGFAPAAAVTVAKGSPPASTLWSFDVTTLVQSWVSGSVSNQGFMLAKNQATGIGLFGTSAASGAPVLEVNYTLEPATPSSLHPSSGAVSVARPTLTFDADDDIVSLRVQIDPASNPLAPAFDSLEVPAVAGLIDLTQATPGGTYAGLANGASTTWRALQKNANGWALTWSSWATFSRANKAALAITAPSSGAITDGTPPITWTFAGTQTAWQVRLLDTGGKVVADSGRQLGTTMAWTPAKGLTKNGQTGTIEIRVWDNVDREATPGDPTYIMTTLAVTLTLSGAVTPVATLVVDQDDDSPVVQLTGTRASIPDEVRVFVNGTQVATYVGTDVFTGTNFAIPDVSAPMNVSASYRVAAVVNGVVASGGPVVAYTPRCQGIWLIDEANHADLVPIITDQHQAQDQPELAIVHTPISGTDDDEVQVVRRRLASYPPQGDIAGTVLDALGFDPAASEALLHAWKVADAGHLYRLVLGNLNRTVIIGDLDFEERPDNKPGQRLVDVTFNWWSQK